MSYVRLEPQEARHTWLGRRTICGAGSLTYRVADDRRRQRDVVDQIVNHEVQQAAVGLGPEDTVYLPLPSHRTVLDWWRSGGR